MIRRRHNNDLIERIKEPRRAIQVIAGPRQVGKTTMVRQVLNEIHVLSKYYNADAVPPENREWISECWEEVRAKVSYEGLDEAVLVIDEIHKIDNWSEQVKREWDNDTFNGMNIKVVLLGSSRLLFKSGLTESLAGRFEILYMGHWTYEEMREAFDINIEQYVYYGGYPGSAAYMGNEARWRRYMRDAIIAPAIEKDVLMTTYIYKPALMHQLFYLGCSYSGELLSYNKMLGSLQDAGNATSLVNYMNALDESKLVGGLQKYAVDQSRKYRSIPMLQVYNNALMTGTTDRMTYAKARTQPAVWRRWVESAVGCYLMDKVDEIGARLYYWRENNDEVDFVVVRGTSAVAIEVKSGHEQTNRGLGVFREKYHPKHLLVVGGDAMPLADFYRGNIETLL